MDGRTIGRVAEETGCKVETIRFYEKSNLIPKPYRSPGGHRLFSEDSVRRIRFIRRSRDLGFSLEEVKKLLAIVDGNEKSIGSVKAVIGAHLQHIKAKIYELQAMERSFSRLMRQYDKTGSKFVCKDLR